MTDGGIIALAVLVVVVLAAGAICLLFYAVDFFSRRERDRVE